MLRSLVKHTNGPTVKNQNDRARMPFIVDVFRRKPKTVRGYFPASSSKQFSESLEKRGDKTCFVWYDKSHNLKSISYRGFFRLIKTEAAAFHALGFEGKRIAIIGETSPQWIATYLSAIASGNIAIPMDKELKTEEIAGFIKVADIDAVVYSQAFNKKFADENGNTSLPVEMLIPISPDAPLESRDGIRSFDSLLRLGIDELERGYDIPVPNDLNRMAVMLFTSGTTGTSKCVMLSQTNVFSTVNAASEAVDLCGNDTSLSVLPIHHTYELCCLLSTLSYGMTVTINDSLRNVMKNITVFKPTMMVLVPLFLTTINKRITETAKKEKKDKLLYACLKASGAARHLGIDVRKQLFEKVRSSFGGNLKQIICGGAPLNPGIAKRLTDYGINIYEGYGITECSPLISVNPYYAPKHGSVGVPVKSCRVRIAADHKNDIGFDEGEIQVKGDNVMLGYYNNPEATAAVFTDDGWFRTGDEGFIDRQGYVYITGRLKSVIVLENGKNVFPEEIEEYLYTLDCVGECVVVGQKNEGSDTVILTAVVYPSNQYFPAGTETKLIQSTLEKKIAELNRSIVGYKQIRNVRIREIPFEKTTTHKIKRHLVS